MPVDYIVDSATMHFYKKGEGLGDAGIGVIYVKHCETNAILSGAHGEMCRSDMRDMMLILHEKGVTNLYFYRNEGHIAPLARLLDSGAFAGFYEIKMSDFIDRFCRHTEVVMTKVENESWLTKIAAADSFELRHIILRLDELPKSPDVDELIDIVEMNVDYGKFGDD